jgi:CheY-like chemotaxis protein
MSFQLLSMVRMARSFLAVRRGRRTQWPRLLFICWLSLLAVGTLLAQPRWNASPVNNQTETPVQLDSYQLEEIQNQARENTEVHRIRIALPQGAFASQSVSGLNGRGSKRQSPNALTQIRSSESAMLLLKFLCIPLGLGVWFLVARKLAPELAESLTSWMPARVSVPAVSTDLLVTLLAEEKAVLEFQAALGAAPGVGDQPAEAQAGKESPYSPAAGYVREMLRLLQEAGRNVAPASQRGFLVDALDRVQSLKNLAKPDELLPLRQMTSAVEMLLKQLTEKSSNLTSSSLRTATLGVTILEELCQPGLKPNLLSDPPLRLLVVDDETFSRYALSHSLKRGLGEPDVAESGELALTMAAQRAYDLIFLDVQMPGMDGFEVCSRIHETLPNQATPVVFVTSLRDFDARANSILCGGRDLIAKPFLTFELAVKALTLVATERLRGRTRMTDAFVEELKAAEPAALLPEAPELVIAVERAANLAVERAKERSDEEPIFVRRRMPLVPAVGAAGEDEVSEVERAESFFIQARVQMDVMRELAEMIRSAPDNSVKQQMITELVLGIHLLAVSAEGCRQHSIAMMAAALEGLLRKMLENAANLTASALEAMTMAAALIHEVCVQEPDADLAVAPPIRALVVDDDPVCLRAMSNALQMRFSKPESASDGKSAMALAAEKSFDVIFLDVHMPDVDGFEVCSRIRETAANRDTPVVFVTSHNAELLRDKFEICGSTDFLAKPYLSSELNLRALALALRGRMQGLREPVFETAN